MSNICSIAMIRSSLQDRVSKLMLKKFYEIDPGLLYILRTKHYATVFQASDFVSTSHFHHSLIFVCKVKSLPAWSAKPYQQILE